jgi:cholesterol transport system auxiliary component
MTRSRTFVLSVAVLACVAAVGGCGSAATYQKETFLLEASPPPAPAAGPIPATLSVQHFSVDPAFADRNLIYRLGEYKYEPDYYREFLVSPSTMITEQTRQWLADSGVFAQVLPRASRLQSEYTLEGSVTALYGDFRDEAAPAAVLEIRFFLLHRGEIGQTIVFTRTYRSVHPILIRTGEAMMDALSKDFTEILTRLEADLGQALRAKPAQPTTHAP